MGWGLRVRGVQGEVVACAHNNVQRMEARSLRTCTHAGRLPVMFTHTDTHRHRRPPSPPPRAASGPGCSSAAAAPAPAVAAARRAPTGSAAAARPPGSVEGGGRGTAGSGGRVGGGGGVARAGARTGWVVCRCARHVQFDLILPLSLLYVVAHAWLRKQPCQHRLQHPRNNATHHRTCRSPQPARNQHTRT